jgi:hypothetical protein
MSASKVASSAHGVVLVMLSGLSVGAWAVHVLALSSLARRNQLDTEVIWLMQAATLVTAIPCVVTIAVGWMTARRAGTDEGEGSPGGRTVFLGWMAVLIGSFNLALILLEAVYVSAIQRYA